jgi:hypothetical protein
VASDCRELPEKCTEGGQLVGDPGLHLSLARGAGGEEETKRVGEIEGEHSRLFREKPNVGLLQRLYVWWE